MAAAGEGGSGASSSSSRDGDYRAVVGETIRSATAEYEVLDFLGKGTFGQVSIGEEIAEGGTSHRNQCLFTSPGPQVLATRQRRGGGAQSPEGSSLVRQTGTA